MATIERLYMEFSHFQQEAWKTAIYPDKGNNFVYPALGLAGEAGEVAEKIKKVIRDNKGKINDERRWQIAGEIGDVLWYCATLATEIQLDLGHIAQLNLNKLASRKARGVLQGSGDAR